MLKRYIKICKNEKNDVEKVNQNMRKKTPENVGKE